MKVNALNKVLRTKQICDCLVATAFVLGVAAH